MSSPLIAIVVITGLIAFTFVQDDIWPIIWIVGGSSVVTFLIMYVFYRVASSDEQRTAWRKLSLREKWRIMGDNSDV